MYTIVGLGNPGGEYAHTRHNAGRIVVTKLALSSAIELKEKKKPDLLLGSGTVYGEKIRLIVPNTFMNASGKAVGAYIKSVPAAKKLIVVYDDIDLPLGVVRVAFGSSSGGHNGVKSIERAIKTKNFIKIRVGVAKASTGKLVKAKKPVGEKAVIDYLLGIFTKKEYELVESRIYERAALALQTTLETGDPVLGMNAVNGLPLLTT